MGNWVCLNCNQSNSDNMKFCSVCHQPRMLADPQSTLPFSEYQQQPVRHPMPQVPFPYPTDPAAAPVPSSDQMPTRMPEPVPEPVQQMPEPEPVQMPEPAPEPAQQMPESVQPPQQRPAPDLRIQRSIPDSAVPDTPAVPPEPVYYGGGSDAGRKLRIALIAANAVCLVLNSIGVIFLSN